MRNEFTAIIEQDESWYIAYSPEMPGANGQGRTLEEALQSLAGAIIRFLKIAARMACAPCQKMPSELW